LAARRIRKPFAEKNGSGRRQPAFAHLLPRWLRDCGIDAYVIHATSAVMSREHRRVNTDRIDTAMLKRGFLGWLRGEHSHCGMVAILAIAEEDAKRPHRERSTA